MYIEMAFCEFSWWSSGEGGWLVIELKNCLVLALSSEKSFDHARVLQYVNKDILMGAPLLAC